MPLPPMATATTTDSAAASARRFAVACGVLSQFVKSGAGPVPLPMSPSSCNAAHEGSVQQPDGPPADGAQQLTIFYGGRVVVIDGCTPGRAAELIRYATAAALPAADLVDMPIARKASLRRFLSKRKDRSATHVGRWEEMAAPAKKGKTEASSWLALGSLGDMHAPRSDRSPQHDNVRVRRAVTWDWDLASVAHYGQLPV